jgi:hypothetical protein
LVGLERKLLKRKINLEGGKTREKQGKTRKINNNTFIQSFSAVDSDEDDDKSIVDIIKQEEKTKAIDETPIITPVVSNSVTTDTAAVAAAEEETKKEEQNKKVEKEEKEDDEEEEEEVQEKKENQEEIALPKLEKLSSSGSRRSMKLADKPKWKAVKTAEGETYWYNTCKSFGNTLFARI